MYMYWLLGCIDTCSQHMFKDMYTLYCLLSLSILANLPVHHVERNFACVIWHSQPCCTISPRQLSTPTENCSNGFMWLLSVYIITCSRAGCVYSNWACSAFTVFTVVLASVYSVARGLYITIGTSICQEFYLLQLSLPQKILWFLVFHCTLCDTVEYNLIHILDNCYQLIYIYTVGIRPSRGADWVSH